MNFGVILRNGFIILGILGAVFVSQKVLVKSNSQEYTYPQKTAQNGNSMGLGGLSDAYSKVQSSISGGAASANSTISGMGEGIEKEKNNLAESSLQKTRLYIAEKLLSALGLTPEQFCNSN